MNKFAEIKKVSDDLQTSLEKMKQLGLLGQFSVDPVYDDLEIKVIIVPIVSVDKITVNFHLN